MKLDVSFSETNQTFDVAFGVVQNISDGSYEDGYTEGYAQGEADGRQQGYTEGRAQGYAEGEAKGYADGLAARSYETWTLTLVDGSTVEKEVALL